jgi:signal transduction histidine kinase
MNLKSYLMLHIALVAAACLLIACVYVSWNAARELDKHASSTLELITKQLELDLIFLGTGFGGGGHFPHWEDVVESSAVPFCVRYIDPQDRILKSGCRGLGELKGRVPTWFAAGYHAVFDPGREISRTITWRNQTYGTVVLTPDAQSQIAAAWQDISGLIAFTGITVLALCALVYAILSHALRPAGQVVAALEQLEAGRLSTRLPRFHLMELQKMSAGFNALAESLEQNITERERLARKLVTVQEEERRSLALELHDEFGQCLAAIKAVGASISHTAETDCPKIVAEAAQLGKIAQHMTDMLRGMLQRLRPPGIDELGLVSSLQSLVAQWNGRATHIELDVQGQFEHLPHSITVSVYRLVQECLTNVSKHAGATQVRVRLERAAADGSTRTDDCIGVTVEDDGMGSGNASSTHQGMGLLGMKERVSALGGQLLLQRREPRGLVVRAFIPVTA